MRIFSVSILLLAQFMSGCVSTSIHLKIPDAPKADAPIEQRVQYYDAYGTLEKKTTTTVYGNFWMFNSVTDSFLKLKNGDLVNHVEDLKPALAHEMRTVELIDEHLKYERRARTWGRLSIATLGVGMGMLVAGGSFVTDQDTADILSLAGLGAVITSVGFMFPATSYGGRSGDFRERAFELYDADLKASLNLKAKETAPKDRFEDIDAASAEEPQVQAQPQEEQAKMDLRDEVEQALSEGTSK